MGRACGLLRRESGRGGCSGSLEVVLEGVELSPTLATPEAGVADLVDSVRPDVLKESSQHFRTFEGHRARVGAVGSRVLEDDMAFGDIEDTVLVHWPMKEGASEVAEDLFDAVYGLLDVDLPTGTRPVFGEFCVIEGVGPQGHESFAEGLGQDLFRGEEWILERAPDSHFIDAAGGQDTVDVRVVSEGARGGVECGHDGESATQIFGIGTELCECLIHSGHEQGIGVGLVSSNERMKAVGDAEDDVEVGYGE